MCIGDNMASSVLRSPFFTITYTNGRQFHIHISNFRHRLAFCFPVRWLCAVGLSFFPLLYLLACVRVENVRFMYVMRMSHIGLVEETKTRQ